MISYAPFWKTLKKSKESTYTLIHVHGVSSSTIQRLRENKHISTLTINDLCRILDCNVKDILIYEPNDNDTVL